MLFSLASLSDVDAYPKSDLAEDDSGQGRDISTWSLGQLAERNDLAPRRDEALQKIQEVCATTILRFRIVAG
jgi:hypothetical protein